MFGLYEFLPHLDIETWLGHLICRFSSDLHLGFYLLSTDKYKRHSRAICSSAPSLIQLIFEIYVTHSLAGFFKLADNFPGGTKKGMALCEVYSNNSKAISELQQRLLIENSNYIYIYTFTPFQYHVHQPYNISSTKYAFPNIKYSSLYFSK